jgi:hypothetical protein
MSMVCHFCFCNHANISSLTSPSGGKCSICGEPYDKKVKLFEKGGAMYKGTIVKTYIQGEQIDVQVMVSQFTMNKCHQFICYA